MENKFDVVICLQMEKTIEAKSHWVNPYPNTQLDL